MCVFCIVTLYKLALVCRLKPTKLVFVLYFYFQYLDFGGFDGTLAEFERECRAKNKPINDLDKRAHGDEKRIMAQVVGCCTMIDGGIFQCVCMCVNG